MSKGKTECGREDCPCYYEPLTDEWYISIQTSEWDEYDDDFVYERFYIEYCPYCGKHLGKNKNEV